MPWTCSPMPAKPSKKKPDTLQQKKQKKKTTLAPAKPKKLGKKVKKMLRRQHPEWTVSQPQMRWRPDTAAGGWYDDSVDFNWNGVSFEQQQAEHHNQWLRQSWRKDSYYRYDSSRLGHQRGGNNASAHWKKPDPTKRWPARTPCQNPRVGARCNYGNFATLTENNGIPHRAQNSPLHGSFQGRPIAERPTLPSGCHPVVDRPTLPSGGCSTAERPTSPSGGSKLNMSLKTSINNILKAGVSSKGGVESTEHDLREESIEHDRGEVLLQRAENMCRQFRESREQAKIENKKKLERSALDEQIVLYGERTRLKARGVLPGKTSVPPSAASSSWNNTLAQHGTNSWKSAPATSRGVFDESGGQVRFVRDGSNQPAQRHAVPGGLTRVRRDSSETLDRDRISKLVNAPRSRKERLQLEKILQSHKPFVRPAVRPKLHLETAVAETSEGELDFSELPGDILEQIEMLIQSENDLESDGIIKVDSNTFYPPDIDSTWSGSKSTGDLHLEDLYSTSVSSSQSRTVCPSVVSTSQSHLDSLVTCEGVTRDNVATVSKGACQTVVTASEGACQTVVTAFEGACQAVTAVRVSRTAATGTEDTVKGATHQFQQSVMSTLDHNSVTSTSAIHPASSSVQSSSVYRPVYSSNMVHVKSEHSDNCEMSSALHVDGRQVVTTEGDYAREHRNFPERGSTTSFENGATTGQIQGQTGQVKGQDGCELDVAEMQAQAELSDSGGKRRSQVGICASKEAKRQRVNSTIGSTVPSTTSASHDAAMNMEVPSTGEGTLAMVLAISLRENQVIGKLADTGVAIEKLEKLLKETKEQLNRRLGLKQELLDEQVALREERLKILSEHKLLSTSAREPVATTASTSIVSDDNMSFSISAGTTVGGDGEVSHPQLTFSTPQLESPSVNAPSSQPDACHDVSSLTTSASRLPITAEDSQTPEDTKPRVRRRKSASFCVDDSSSAGPINITTPAKSVNMSSGVCLNYLGTLEGEGIEAEPFLNHVTNISPFVILEPMPGHWVTSSQVNSADEGTQHKSRQPKKVKSAGKNGTKPAGKRMQTRRSSSSEVSCDSTVSKEDECFKKPEPIKEWCVHKNANQEADYEKFKQSVTGSKKKKKSQLRNKLSEVYPGPDANVHKKLKSKKERKQSNSIASRDSSVDSSSDCTEQPDVSASSVSVKQSGRKRPNKRCPGPISKAMQEYLHAESSSDVEITGLQTPGKTSTVSCQSVIDYSSVDDTSSVGSTATQPSTQAGCDGQSGNSDFIALCSSENESQGYVSRRQSTALGCFEGHEGPVRCIFLWRGKVLLTGSEDGTARQFKLTSRQHRCGMVYKGHTQGVSCIHVSNLGNEGTRVFTGSYDGNMLIFRYKSGVQLFALQYGVQVNAMHANWNRLFLGLSSGVVVKYDFQEYRNGQSITCAESGITCLASATEGARKLLCVASNDCLIAVRDAITGLLIHTLDGHTKTPLCMCVRNHFVYSAGTDKTVHVYNLNTAELLKTLRLRAVINCIQVRGNCLFVACYDGTIRCYDTQNYKLQNIYYGAGKAAVMALAITGNLIFTGNREGFCEGVVMTDSAFKCEYGSCDLVYASKQYLHHHVMTEHTNNIKKNDHCQWRNCNVYLHWNTSPQAAIKHTSSHILDR